MRAICVPANLPPQEMKRALNEHCREASAFLAKLLRQISDLGPESLRSTKEPEGKSSVTVSVLSLSPCPGGG